MENERWKKLLQLNFQMSRLNDFNTLIEFEFDAVNSFLDNSDNMIKLKEKELKDRLEKWEIERLSYDNAPEPFDMFETEIICFNQFTRLLNNSLFLMTYSILEKYMFEICSFCQQMEGKKISAKDLKGEGYIDQCRKYIQNVIEIDLTNLQAEWGEIKKYQTIRNSIAHKDSKINDIKSDLKSFIDSTTEISYNEKDSSISIDSYEFISKFTLAIKQYISKLTNEIYNKKST